jgi:tetraacyldisaccharide 4'-kinase
VNRSAIAHTLLEPLGVLYGAAMRLRTVGYQAGVLHSRRLPGTVISVGNLTVGGTGKTPMVLWIAERLIAEGHRPAILTRGYRGLGVGNSGDAAPDEVALLQKRLRDRAQFGVGKYRYKNGLALSKNGAEWFILDDGFQHLELERDADVVLLDSTDPFEAGAVLPAGRLREPRSALARADVVVITRTSFARELEADVRRFTRAPIFYAQMRFAELVLASCMKEGLPEAEGRKQRFFAFCGIGNPVAFFNDLTNWGFSVVQRRSFADHHRYSPAEIRDLETAAIASGANALICTEKDLFNLPHSLATTLPMYACRIRLALTDEEAFWKAVRAAIGRSQPVTQA